MPATAPTLENELREKLDKAGFRDEVDYCVKPVSHNFDEDPAYPSNEFTVVAIAPESPSKHIVDALLLKVCYFLHCLVLLCLVSISQ